ncbi:Uma2 family endonuclease [Myxococcota bacterium]|nr:Uma2 family endonuclease [Myxococcota bacterium]
MAASMPVDLTGTFTAPSPKEPVAPVPEHVAQFIAVDYVRLFGGLAGLRLGDLKWNMDGDALVASWPVSGSRMVFTHADGSDQLDVEYLLVDGSGQFVPVCGAGQKRSCLDAVRGVAAAWEVPGGLGTCTEERFWELADGTELRLELWEGRVVGMAGGTTRHSAIANALIVALWEPMIRNGCMVWNSDVAVRVRSDKIRYPDVTVDCAPRQEPPGEVPVRFVERPTVWIEVLSSGSTEGVDRGTKLSEALGIDSLEAYILVHQDQRRVEIWRRGAVTAQPEVLTHGSVDIHGVIVALDVIYMQAARLPGPRI